MPSSQLLHSLAAHLRASKSRVTESSPDARLLALMPEPNIERALGKFQAAVFAKEQRLRELWRRSRDRAKREWNELVSGSTTESSSSQSSPVSRQPMQPLRHDPRQLEAMYGTDGWLRSTVLSVIGNASHAFMHHANTVHMEGAEVMRQALDRPAGQALITVSNHVAAVDDPLVISAILPKDVYSQPSAIRWTLCATDRCFKYASLFPFFQAAKVLPVQRGGGLQQPGMMAAEARLAQGDWVHIFPEGTRSRDPEQLGPVRKGIGRLVAAAAAAAEPGTPPPLVVPFVHAGMERIMPVGSKLPSVGQEVHIIVGEPIPVADILSAAERKGSSQQEVYSAITDRVEQHLQQLHRRVRLQAAGQASGVAQQEGSCTQAGEEQQGSGVLPAPWWPPAFTKGGDWWGPAQQRHWEHMAFGMWHRMWVGRMDQEQTALPAAV